MSQLIWEPIKNEGELKQLAWWNTISHYPSFTVDTLNKREKSRIVTIVKRNEKRYTIIIDGAHHNVHVIDLISRLNQFFSYSVVELFAHVIKNNEIFN